MPGPCDSSDQGNPYLRAETLTKLLAWHDVDFVRCAYVTLLGRQPDPEGESHFTQRLRRGQSKLALISALRNSAEGRKHDPGIAGLDRSVKQAARQRLPLIGGLFRRFGSGVGEISRPDDALRSLLNATGFIQSSLVKLHEQVATVEAQLLQQASPQGSRSQLGIAGGSDPAELPEQITRAHTGHLLSRPRAPLANFFHRELGH